MPYNESDLVDVSPSGRGFGASSEDRKAIINFMEEGVYYDAKEVKAGSEVEKAPVRLAVMVRDKLVNRKYTADSVPVYTLAEKALTRKAKVTNDAETTDEEDTE